MNQVKDREETVMGSKKQSYWWWFDSHNSPRKSHWLQSTLAELDEKTKAMLKLIDEDADSFAQRAEMYYKKRPELISMVGEFYRAHRSLAERYEQLKTEPTTRFIYPLTHYSSPLKGQVKMASSNLYKSHDGYSQEAYGSEESSQEACDSEIDDPDDSPVSKGERDGEEPQPYAADYEEVMKMIEEMNRLKEENELQNEIIHREQKVQQELRARLIERGNDMRKLKEEKEKLVAAKTLMTRQQKNGESEEIMKLREQVERLQEENANEKKQLMEKDEEKREVIRQMSVAVNFLRDENLLLKKSIARQGPKKKNPLESYVVKGFGMLFNLLPKSQSSMVPV